MKTAQSLVFFTNFVCLGASRVDSSMKADEPKTFQKFKSFFGGKNQEKKPFYDVTIDPLQKSGILLKKYLHVNIVISLYREVLSTNWPR
jgi:hypothetical protein